MDDFATYQNQDRHILSPQRDTIIDDSDRDSIFRDDNDNPGEIYTSAPKEAFKLGYFDVMCLVLNRMIGRLISFFVGQISPSSKSFNLVITAMAITTMLC